MVVLKHFPCRGTGSLKNKTQPSLRAVIDYGVAISTIRRTHIKSGDCHDCYAVLQ
ncbi:MAG: hypothetical protein IJR46_08190 [Neisseriaceae bacterium]|nr:hypothetical protein [Neisseriaceae bacterium]